MYCKCASGDCVGAVCQYDGDTAHVIRRNAARLPFLLVVDADTAVHEYGVCSRLPVGTGEILFQRTLHTVVVCIGRQFVGLDVTVVEGIELGGLTERGVIVGVLVF